MGEEVEGIKKSHICKNGSYSANICYSISAKSSNFAVEMCKCKIKKMKRFFTFVFALSTMTLMAQTPINIIVGSKTFTATLADSETGEAFSARLSCTFEKKVVPLHRNSKD